MGMELALLVLFVVFACSILLVSSALLGKGNLTNRKDTLTERLALDMVAEQAIKNETVENENYAVRRENNTMVIVDKSGQEKLTVTWEDGKITGWDYH